MHWGFNEGQGNWVVVRSGNYVGPILDAADNLVIKGPFAI